ncbi:hypothetical protein ABPG74_017419 [Tetrahymena malaccensis]
MSIYNGFSTRKQEQDYNILLEQTFFLLQTYIVKAIKNERIDENKFTSYFEKLFNTMEQFESHKYLDPKYSVILRPLAKTLNIKRYQFIDGAESNSSTIVKKQNSPTHANLRSSSNNFSSAKKTTQNNQNNQENKQTEITQSGKWLYQTISEIGNQKSQIMASSSTKNKETEGNFNQEISSEAQGNGKYFVQLKTISNRVQVQTPSSYRAFCLMTLSPSPSNNSTIQINENSSIQLKVPKKIKQQSSTLTAITAEKKQDEPEKSIFQITQPCSQTEVLNKQQQNQNKNSSTNNLTGQNEEQNIRLDKVVLQKFNIENQVYDEETEQIIQSSRNYNKVYQETSSLSVGRRNNLDPINNSFTLNKQNLLVTRNQKKNKLQQQRKLLQEEELEISRKEDKLAALQENQYSTKNDSSFYSQTNGRHSDLSNHHSNLQNNIEQDYVVNKNSRNPRGFLLPKGNFLNRNAFSKNVSPVNLSNTINYDDTNYYPIKNFQKAIPILKPLYHSVDTGERMKQESLSIRECKNSQNTRRNSSIQIQISNNNFNKNFNHNLLNSSNNLTQRGHCQTKDKIEASARKKKYKNIHKEDKLIEQQFNTVGNPKSLETTQSLFLTQSQQHVNSQGRCKSFIYYNNNFTMDSIKQLSKNFSEELMSSDITFKEEEQQKLLLSNQNSSQKKTFYSRKEISKNQFKNKKNQHQKNIN